MLTCEHATVKEGRLCAENIPASIGMRHALHCSNPKLKELAGNWLNRSSSAAPGVNQPCFNWSDTASFNVMQLARFGAYTLDVLHSGSPKVWTVTWPSNNTKLEKFFRKELIRGDPRHAPNCSHYVAHREIYVPRDVLERHEIENLKVVQNEGEMIIIFPWAYHQSYSTGPNICETTMYASDRWQVFHHEKLYRNCSHKCKAREPFDFEMKFVVPRPPRRSNFAPATASSPKRSQKTDLTVNEDEPRRPKSPTKRNRHFKWTADAWTHTDV